MIMACTALDFPVVSGNVSLYNETNDKHPSFLVEDIVRARFQNRKLSEQKVRLEEKIEDLILNLKSPENVSPVKEIVK